MLGREKDYVWVFVPDTRFVYVTLASRVAVADGVPVFFFFFFYEERAPARQVKRDSAAGSSSVFRMAADQESVEDMSMRLGKLIAITPEPAT